MKKESKNLLIVVEGDKLSDDVSLAAKRNNFKGEIMKLTPKEAEAQCIPLPRLYVGKYTYGPITIKSYFKD